MEKSEFEYVIRIIFKQQPWPIYKPNFPLETIIDNTIKKSELDLAFDELLKIDEKKIRENLVNKRLIKIIESNGQKFIEPNEQSKIIKGIRKNIAETIYKYKFEQIIESKVLGPEFRIIAVLLCYSKRSNEWINFIDLIRKAQVRREKFDEYINFWNSHDIIKIFEKNPDEKKIRHTTYYTLNRDNPERIDKLYRIEQGILEYHKYFNKFIANSIESQYIISIIKDLYYIVPEFYYEKEIQINKINARKGNNKNNIDSIFSLINRIYEKIDPLFLHILDDFRVILSHPENVTKNCEKLVEIHDFLIQNYSDILYRIYQKIAKKYDDIEMTLLI